MNKEQRLAVDDLKKIGASELLSLQRKQRFMSAFFGDKTGEAAKRDVQINIALEELGQ